MSTLKCAHEKCTVLLDTFLNVIQRTRTTVAHKASSKCPGQGGKWD